MTSSGQAYPRRLLRTPEELRAERAARDDVIVKMLAGLGPEEAQLFTAMLRGIIDLDARYRNMYLATLEAFYLEEQGKSHCHRVARTVGLHYNTITARKKVLIDLLGGVHPDIPGDATHLHFAVLLAVQAGVHSEVVLDARSMRSQ